MLIETFRKLGRFALLASNKKDDKLLYKSRKAQFLVKKEM
jgi:hypothetical protein